MFNHLLFASSSRQKKMECKREVDQILKWKCYQRKRRNMQKKNANHTTANLHFTRRNFSSLLHFSAFTNISRSDIASYLRSTHSNFSIQWQAPREDREFISPLSVYYIYYIICYTVVLLGYITFVSLCNGFGVRFIVIWITRRLICVHLYVYCITLRE